MIKKLLAILLFPLLTSCFDSLMRILDEGEYGMDVENRSNHPIDVYVKAQGYPNITLPDTIFYSDLLMRVKPGDREFYLLSAGGYWLYDQVTRVSVYIFHSDTIDKYSWREVVEGNKILERHDLNAATLYDNVIIA